MTAVNRALWTAAALVLLLAAWSFWWEPQQLVTREMVMRLPCWTTGPVRVAVVSDLHVGSPFMTMEKLRLVVDRINAGHPDMIVLLGDFVVTRMIGGRFIAPEVFAPELAKLQAPLGVFAILGNHDQWLGAARVASALRSAHIHVIEDEAWRVGAFWLAGVSDFREAPHDVNAALENVSDSAPVIVITHDPDVFPLIPKRVCLTLAGHTHGGQVAIPLIGRLIVPSEYGQRYAIGHVREGGRDLFVTSGVGTSIIGVRFRVPPEIVFMEITR